MVNAAALSSHQALARAWLDDLASVRTRDAYGRDLAAFVTWCEANGHQPLEVSPSEVDSYRDDCGRRGVLPATIARRLSALSSFYDHAIAAQAVDSNPVHTVTRPPAQRSPAQPSLAEREALALLDAASATGPKAAVLVTLLLLEGMKLGEVLALDIEQLDGSAWAMRAAIARRGGVEHMALDGRTVQAITTYLGDRTTGPLLVGDSPTRHGATRLTRFGADFLLKRVAVGAGLGRRVSANTLRRTYIVLSHRDGTPLKDIVRRVGHSRPRDTRRYLA